MTPEYAIIVKNKTRLEALIERFNTKAQAKFYIEKQGASFEDYELEDEAFKMALHKLQTSLSSFIKNKIVERTFIPSYIFSPKNIIVVIGQDGLVANTAKYSMGLPIIAVNPDKERYDGALLPFDVFNFTKVVEKVMSGTYNFKEMKFAKATLNDGQSIMAFNDLFIGAASHVSARYKISFSAQKEEHSSSGIIVSTTAGSTGWMSSIYNMAFGINKKSKIAHTKPQVKNDELLFVVREPFKSKRTQTEIVSGKINLNSQLQIESLMPRNGIIFSDGIESDYLNFNSGSIATIGLSQESAKIVQ